MCRFSRSLSFIKAIFSDQIGIGNECVGLFVCIYLLYVTLRGASAFPANLLVKVMDIRMYSVGGLFVFSFHGDAGFFEEKR